MSHSIHRIRIHVIWSTKNRYPFIAPTIEGEVYDYMRSQFNKSGCRVRIINGMPDHVHCLFSLGRQLTVEGIIKQVKGATSRWINKEKLTDLRFAWQTGYAAYSVSESVL